MGTYIEWLYTDLKRTGVNVLSFNSDKNTILVNNTTSTEILMLKNVMNAIRYDCETPVTIELVAPLSYNIHLS